MGSGLGCEGCEGWGVGGGGVVVYNEMNVLLLPLIEYARVVSSASSVLSSSSVSSSSSSSVVSSSSSSSSCSRLLFCLSPFSFEIQAHKRFKRTKYKSQRCKLSGQSPLSSYKTSLKQELNGEKRDLEIRHVSAFG